MARIGRTDRQPGREFRQAMNKVTRSVAAEELSSQAAVMQSMAQRFELRSVWPEGRSGRGRVPRRGYGPLGREVCCVSITRSPTPMQRSFLTRWVRAGALLAFVDFCWALVLTAAYGRPPMSVWNGVASVAFGPEMLTNGWHGIVIGLAMHVTTAFSWSLVFLLAETNFSPLRKWLSTRGGELAVGFVYGPFIWVMMSSVVVPTMTGNPLHITYRWFVQLAGHMVFVGMPIVVGARRSAAAPA